MADTTAPPERQIEEHTSSAKTRRDEYRVRGDRIMAKLRELLHEGNVRHIVIKNDRGKTLIELPVTVGIAGAVLLPVWAAVGAVAAVVANFKIMVEREDQALEA